ncbi:MAG: 2,5-diamino-6-(ribosylamino)-4(3H)-pyrimidinone 5'-phosphate reductase [Methanothrix sp.]|uniref:2,5-diamino-6-(ribosylamino)-4(3H)-pyrimidinone 5'-phosphate reductase n=1 Tax=Methanothrix sp. TaxID=90426 RepID=UPI0025E4EEA6|nr:2,5-diamino-6-(ribosylamino)-4(3H)-pyrimidinone 5'-phosphate reductase [Methanothrix sp.]MCQ8902906.1 2,5-diamino-6-(ribosylamino)-4(3H)-pyrimidinone 5'-phosphate reductase [Methanothrix sp.]
MRPYVFINSAMSADGKISSFLRRQVRISGSGDLLRVDRLRAESDAVMVGVGTVIADNPKLRVKSEALRSWRLERGMPENPLRVVADSRARTPPYAEVLGPGCIIAVSRSAPAERTSELSKRCEIAVCGEDRVDLGELLEMLYQRGVRRLMVEGGGTLNWSLIEQDLVDEICVFVGGLVIGGKDAPTLVDGSGFAESFRKLELISADRLDDGVLIKWRVVRSA